MVWPFGKRDDNSPDSFERVLAKLATQIQTQSTQVATLRQRHRRLKALWTLYSLFGYTIYAVSVVLLQGYENLGPKEAAGILGGPFVIYGIRKLLDLFYDWRTSTTQARLDELQARQKDTIEKLKAATKYSTTQSLIEKYGGTVTLNTDEKKGKSAQQKGPSPKTPDTLRQRSQAPQRALTPQQQVIQQKLLEQQRAGIPPPFGQPQAPPKGGPVPPMTLAQAQAQTQPSSQQHLQPEEASASKWYDRILDVVIGEDETSAKARYALICKSCRMVNGLAPPGTKDLNEMEPWGCARCGTWNGNLAKKHEQDAEVKKEEDVESEAEGSDLKEMVEKPTKPKRAQKKVAPVEEDEEDEDSGPEKQIRAETPVTDEEEQEEVEEDETPKPRTRSRASKGRKRK